MTDQFEIRTMTRQELDGVVEWAAAEGWNPGLHDAPVFYETDATGYYLGLLNGEPIGSISSVKYSADYAFLGFFIVKPEHRGKKYGLQLWQHAIDSLGDAVAGLDGVIAQTANYARSGFVSATQNQRYLGTTSASAAIDPRITPYTAADLDMVTAYDQACFPAPRRRFLQGWLQQPEAHALVYREGSAMRGYGMIRPAREGYRIGPLFADDAAQAAALIDGLSAQVPAGAPLAVDVPQANTAAVALVTSKGMTPVFETARMYRGGSPRFDASKVFGVTSLELG